VTNRTHSDDSLDSLRTSKPRLDTNVRIYLQRYRGEEWYLLADSLAHHHVLVDQTSYRLLQQLEQGTSVALAIEKLAIQHHVEIELSDVAQLLGKLHDAKMLRGDLKPNLEQSINEPPSSWRSKLLTPTSIKIPLLDPDSFLSKISWVSTKIMTPQGAMFFILLLVAAVTIAMTQWAALESHWDRRFMDPANLVFAVMLYPFIKALHEIGHGLVAKHYGAEIHELGIMLLVFFPVPYVDATSTATLYNSRHRMLVASAGILIELALASVAVIGWHYLSQGVAKDLCFNIAILAGTSTLLFNGNPLLRFDGYYVLSDAIEIPNLGPRASAYLGFLFRTRILNLSELAPTMSASERRWFLIYGIASACYRLVVSFAIAMYVAGRFFVLGLLLAVWFLLYQVLRPYLAALISSVPVARHQGKAWRLVGIFTTITVLVPLLLWMIPVQQSTAAYGIVMPPETSLVRAKSSGFISAFSALNGSEVSAGGAIVNLRNEELEFLQRQQIAYLAEREAEYRLALVNKAGNVESLKRDVLYTETQLAQTRMDIYNLLITSPADGKFLLVSNQHNIGRWIERGTVLGVVAGAADWTVQVMFPQASIDLLHQPPRKILAMTLSAPSQSQLLVLDGQTPRATLALPQKSLGTANGGPITVDISDPSGVKLLDPMFQVNLLLPAASYHTGQTVLVWFLHDNEPLGTRLWKSASRKLSTALKQH
jgi:putative peptide zinc metalloprotease protein